METDDKETKETIEIDLSGRTDMFTPPRSPSCVASPVTPSRSPSPVATPVAPSSDFGSSGHAPTVSADSTPGGSGTDVGEATPVFMLDSDKSNSDTDSGVKTPVAEVGGPWWTFMQNSHVSDAASSCFLR